MVLRAAESTFLESLSEESGLELFIFSTTLPQEGTGILTASTQPPGSFLTDGERLAMSISSFIFKIFAGEL